MIYTLTLNPAIDYIVRLDKLTPGAINRVAYEQTLGGGKGINVSIVLSNMGIASTALGFLSGFTGEEILRQLDSLGVKHDFIKLSEGFSRINVKIKAKEETEINGQGPAIPSAAQKKLLVQLRKLTSGDVLVLSGSIPHSLPDDTYERILATIAKQNVRVAVDAEKNLLLNTLKYHPFLIKPNRGELGDIFGATLENNDEIFLCAKKLQDLGARNVLVSLAEAGALLLTEHGENYHSPAPKGVLVNSVGAGDSMLAGFFAGYIDSQGDLLKAFRLSIATGSASAFSEQLATKKEALALLDTF